ncbi:MAG: T9SS type A sorting domain-containing protein [Bacteroidetes bacterium]|nr:T9SS type A sorting domain-containing protein [Bacteroidota bacterium]
MINFGFIVDSATVYTNQRTIPNGKLNLASTYYWKVAAINSLGFGPWSETWNFSTAINHITKIGSEIPTSFSLSQNYPNPFNPTTKIKFDIPTFSNVRINIYDITGREIYNLVNETLTPGSYQTSFDGLELNSGIYFYKLITKNFTETKKMLLLK